MDGNIQFPAPSRYFWGAPHTRGARRLGALFCRGGSQTRPPLLAHGAHPFVGADNVRPPKPPLKREVARRSRDGGFLPPTCSTPPAGDEKPPVTAWRRRQPPFQGGLDGQPAAPLVGREKVNRPKGPREAGLGHDPARHSGHVLRVPRSSRATPPSAPFRSRGGLWLPGGVGAQPPGGHRGRSPLYNELGGGRV